jgi:glyoxylase-like metal-dependent hydrolase (beta-lactamase superfamily II)
MHKLTLFPLGNADSYLIELSGGHKFLFDYANVRDPQDETDLRIDLPGALREKLDTAGLDGFDVVAFTHLHEDHICGATEFLELRHDDEYQGDERIEIGELWVPAAAITEEDLEGEAAVLQAEARHRLREGSGIRVFSRPGKLRGWLKAQGLELDDRRHLITDAGQLVPGWEKDVQGIEFFAHSPFAVRKGLDLEDRNTNSE